MAARAILALVIWALAAAAVAQAPEGVTENADGTATLSYRLPSAVFAPYRHPEVDRLARELDAVLGRIAADAAVG